METLRSVYSYVTYAIVISISLAFVFALIVVLVLNGALICMAFSDGNIGAFAFFSFIFLAIVATLTDSLGG